MLQYLNAYPARKSSSHPVSSDQASSLFSATTSTAAGVDVRPETALSSSAVLACVRGIAEDIAKLPLHLYRTDGRTKELAVELPLYWIAYNEPNPLQTSFEFREWLHASLLVYGYGVAEVERDAFGRPVALWPLHSPNVSMHYIDGRYIYHVGRDDGEDWLLPEQVLHIKGFSSYGLLGSSLVTLGRESVGEAIAQQQYSGKFFSNGAAPRGVLEHPGKLSDASLDHLKKSWGQTYQGLDNAHRVAILEEGMKFAPMGINPKDAQMIEARTFQAAEVARLFRMPLHKIGELSRATFSNIEHQSIEYNQDTLQPHISRWEQRLAKTLLTPAEKRTHSLFFKFELASLLRGDSNARANYLATMVDKGIYSINEARGYEDMNPIEGGDEHRVQINTAPLGSDAATGNTNGGTTNA